MHDPYEDDRTRQKAAARAAKMLKLFNKRTFESIMNAVDPPPIKEPAFTNACRAANLNDTEIAWLRAYLEHCSQALYEAIPEAASSGW